jgi:hypothetical protein
MSSWPQPAPAAISKQTASKLDGLSFPVAFRRKLFIFIIC